MTSKEKIIQYLRFKGVSQRKFSLKTGLSEGFLRSGKDIGLDKVPKIRDNYPDLNMNWLIFDEGEMILNVNEMKDNQILNQNITNFDLIIKRYVKESIEEYMKRLGENSGND